MKNLTKLFLIFCLLFLSSCSASKQNSNNTNADSTIYFLGDVSIKTKVCYEDLSVTDDEKFTNGDSLYYSSLSQLYPNKNEDGTWNVTLGIRMLNKEGVYDPFYGLLVRINEDNTFTVVEKLQFENKGNQMKAYHLLETDVNNLKGRYTVFLLNSDYYGADVLAQLITSELENYQSGN